MPQSEKITLYVFGNPDLPSDNLPITFLSRLKERFPHITFEHKDPNELDIPETETLIVIDTVFGLKNVRWVNIEELSETHAHITAHDFDLETYLQLVKKLTPSLSVHILGIPMSTQKQDMHAIFENITEKITELLEQGKTV